MRVESFSFERTEDAVCGGIIISMHVGINTNNPNTTIHIADMHS